jgi:hypothetical protein
VGLIITTALTGCSNHLSPSLSRFSLTDALERTSRVNADIFVDVTQGNSSQLGGTGRGVVKGVAHESDIIYHGRSGGITEFRQVSTFFYIESYNSPIERNDGLWIKIPAANLAGLLAWPSPGSDPTLAFLSADVMPFLAKRVTQSTEVGSQTVYGEASACYDVDLSTFKPVNGVMPKLIMCVDSSNQVDKLALTWPSSPSGNEGVIAVTISLSNFGGYISEIRPPRRTRSVGSSDSNSHTGGNASGSSKSEL